MKKKLFSGISVGTVLTLAVTAVILFVTIFMITRLSSGQRVDLSALTMQVLALDKSDPRDQIDDIPVHPGTEKTDPVSGEAPAATVKSAATATPDPRPAEGSFTLTAGGTVALESNSRKSGYSNDSKKYDFTPLLNLLIPYIDADINTVFLENILMDNIKVSQAVVPTCCAEMLKNAGFDTVAAGFSRIWDKKEEGVGATRVALRSAGLNTLGIFSDAADAAPEIRTVNGVRVALLQYTDTVPDSTRKAMIKNGTSRMVPGTDTGEITEEIRTARNQADVVIVLIQWGKTNAKAPGKTETALAQMIADAGADIIIGSGIRSVQKMEYLTGKREDGSEHQVFCAYSLGALLSDDRGSAARIAGCLLNLNVTYDGRSVRIDRATYTPTYIWKYKQDSQYYYRVIASDATAPDGMDNDQIKVMKKALTAVQDALADSPVEERK